jgi:predicted Kef-type K+ transport protein
MIAAIVETKTLGEVALYSLAGGIGICVVFALGVSSAASLLDALRERRRMASVGWSALALGCLACTAAAVVLGIVVMSTK